MEKDIKSEDKTKPKGYYIVKNKYRQAALHENNSEKPAATGTEGTAKKRRSQRSKRNNKKGYTKEKLKPASHVNSEVFVFDEIAGNKKMSDLITDLVKCYTCNSTLPKKELELLNKELHDQTLSVFLNIFNKLIDKIFYKVINTEFFKNVLCKTPPLKKNAFCQTDFVDV